MSITIRNSTIIALLFMVTFFQISFGQMDPLYLQFKESSNESFSKEDGSGNIVKEKVYSKSVNSNGDITFFIKDYLFFHDASKMHQELVSCEQKVDKSKLLSVNEMENYIKKIKEKYPYGYEFSKELPKICIVSKKGDTTMIYEVIWKYYIE